MFNSLKSSLRAGRTKPRKHIPADFSQFFRMHSAVCLLDAEDPAWSETARAVEEWFHKHNITCSVIFIYSGGALKKEKLTIPQSQVISEEDFSWSGKPRQRARLVNRQKEDFFLCLCSNITYPMEYLAARSYARLKVCCCPMDGYIFDAIVQFPDLKKSSGIERVKSVTQYLEKLENR